MSTAYCVKVLQGADYISHKEMGIVVVQRSQAELQLAGCRKDLNAQLIPISSQNKRAATQEEKKIMVKKMIILLQPPPPRFAFKADDVRPLTLKIKMKQNQGVSSKQS